MVDEIWTDKEALDNHFNQQHIKVIIPRIQPLLSKPLEVRVYSEIISNKDRFKNIVSRNRILYFATHD